MVNPVRDHVCYELYWYVIINICRNSLQEILWTEALCIECIWALPISNGMKFSYKGRKTNGEIVTGELEAATRADAVGMLRTSEVTPLVLNEKKSFSLVNMKFTLVKRVSLSEKIIFSKNLAGMLHAGLSISRGLQILSKQTGNDYFKTIIADLVATIDRGGTFSSVRAMATRCFSPPESLRPRSPTMAW